MVRDVNVSDAAIKCDVHVWITLQYIPFEHLTTLLGATTDTARAELVGTTRRQINRMRNGERVGEILIARILTTFRRNAARLDRYGVKYGFDDLFAIVEDGALREVS